MNDTQISAQMQLSNDSSQSHRFDKGIRHPNGACVMESWQKADSITITIRTYNLAILANGRHIESRTFDCTYRCLWWLNVRGNLLAWRHWNSTVTRALACRTTNMTHRIVWCIMRRHLWRHNDRWCSIFTVFAQRARIAGFQCDRTCTWPWWMARTNQSEANKDKRKSIKRSRLFVIRVRTFRVFRSAININCYRGYSIVVVSVVWLLAAVQLEC